MNPTDFVDQAIRLCDESTEVSQRSAVSRGYYGAFHVAKQFIESCGLRFSKDSSAVHTRLRYCMDKSDDVEVATAARTLNSLRTARNDADYALDDKRFRGKALASTTLIQVQEVIATLVGAKPRFSAIRKKVRNYARLVRIPVIGSD